MLETSSPFADLPTLGNMSKDAALVKLREYADSEADAVEKIASSTDEGESLLNFSGGLAKWWPFTDRAWQHTAHAFGFLSATDRTPGPRSLRAAGLVEADLSLRGGRVKVVLNALRVADYPGGGTHRILLDFYARNQVPGLAEDVHFNATYRVRESERAPVSGYPIFVGLNVGTEGLAFRCHTVNVQNDSDEAFLKFLEGDVFKAGLHLATVAQPAIAPLSGMALSLTKSIAGRNRNVSVQDFYLGLDFTGTTMGARLAQGDYIAVQVPETIRTVWNWNDWLYDPSSNLIVSANDSAKLIPYNYVVFGVSRYEDH
jgi:hypothetical protein